MDRELLPRGRLRIERQYLLTLEEAYAHPEFIIEKLLTALDALKPQSDKCEINLTWHKLIDKNKNCLSTINSD
ncbi:hypothetical protein DSM107010_57210 [Chroococcidiopsis cubana SAG 39.79]|uniref:Uncharacterized protein n=1 Tax=Chroococcidiopsis cubana SAG 39.79 TaxID=388085 RepID=A0AB37UBL3_9CYAN|nr:hypothetical protein DSM107010_57210 [Chroococcidiopsis cubana SAG 39.79]